MAKNHIIGIDLGGTNLKIALLGLDYKIKDRRFLTTADFSQKQELTGAIVSAARRIIKNNRLKKSDILGVGLGLPGPIDSDKGIVRFLPNIPGWKDVGLKKILERELKLPVFIDNDANLMALAEYKLGAAVGAKNAVCLTLGTGVGGGIILEGKLYRGSGFAAGEIGHLPINERGPECNCSGSACLEAYIGNRRIIRQARKIFKRRISLEELSALARKNNKKAIGIWQSVGFRLGLALSSVVNLLNPDCIVIGGGVSGAGNILLDKVKETILTRAMIVHARTVKLRKAKLGNDAGMIGAAILVKESLLK